MGEIPSVGALLNSTQLKTAAVTSVGAKDLPENSFLKLVVAGNMPGSVAQYIGLSLAKFLTGGFITAIVVNPPERKLAKRTSVQPGNVSLKLVKILGIQCSRKTYILFTR